MSCSRPNHCIIPGCPNNELTGTTPSYPMIKEGKLRNDWLTEMSNSNGYSTQICSLHFQPSDFNYIITSDMKMLEELRPESVPSIFPWSMEWNKSPVLNQHNYCLSTPVSSGQVETSFFGYERTFLGTMASLNLLDLLEDSFQTKDEHPSSTEEVEMINSEEDCQLLRVCPLCRFQTRCEKIFKDHKSLHLHQPDATKSNIFKTCSSEFFLYIYYIYMYMIF